MNQQQDGKDRAARLVELIDKASRRRLRPYRSWASVVDGTVGGEEPLAVVARPKDPTQMQTAHASGELVVVTASYIAYATFTDLAYAMGGSRDDGPFTIDVHPRSAVEVVTLDQPALRRRPDAWVDDVDDEDDGARLPWEAKLRVRLRGRVEPLELEALHSTLPLLKLHALLLDGM
ncbi:hypothetical protein J1G43_12895 [Cellulomonas sp. zg-ZUI22]|uniref:hypothetical protein n=1 Tax=Cellulomonas sp. zg-ZUI22 TaxID=2816955 RepID=UPI001A94BDE2|nr:hypothetical protein [Cellulomonas sp. zg-ZUI22]MBO0900861.1 hypothetical protein [Cellulomonas sp. zg-ZUI22]